MSHLRLLVIEGNVKAARDRAVANGGSVPSDAYAELLRTLSPAGTVVDICYPADPGANIPGREGVDGYDGVAITGSALNVYDGGPAIEPQIELAREVFRTAVPAFGSCWGLQLGTVAAGGTVRRNPKGREIGFGRRIAINEAGHAHPLFVGKPRVFDAITVHLDEVETQAPGTTVLATNAVSAVQAAEIATSGGGGFWGVQYHPEFTFAEMGAILRRYGEIPIREGMFRSEADKSLFIDDLNALHADPHDSALAWKYGLDDSVLDPATRTVELKNWIEQAVLPAKSARGRA